MSNEPSECPGVVSVWVGTFPSLEAAEAYFGIPDEIGVYLPPEGFAADLGLASRRTDTAWPVSAGIEEVARLALSWPAYRPRPQPAQAAELRHHLDELASAITEARPPGTTVPVLPGQPLTAAATAALTSAVLDAHRTPPFT